MAALGDKIGSTILAQAANVPTIPWSGSGVAINFASCNGIIPPEVYDAVRHPLDKSNNHLAFSALPFSSDPLYDASQSQEYLFGELALHQGGKGSERCVDAVVYTLS